MNQIKKILVIGIAWIILLNSCTSTKYIHDPESIKVQHEMQNARTGKNIGDAAIGVVVVIFTVLLAAIFNDGDGIHMEDDEENDGSKKRDFKKFCIKNKSQDTLYINMLTNIAYDNISYSDIMDIRLPGNKGTRLLVPYGADYNVYFRSAADTTDKLTKINTENQRRLKLPVMDMSPIEIIIEKEENDEEYVK